MALKIILDANVLLDLTLNRDGYADAKIIYDDIVSSKFKCFITSSLVHVCAYWLKKYLGTAVAKKILWSLVSDMTFIDASHKIVVDALSSSLNDVEDALQYYTAIEHRLDCIVSNDKGFIKSSVPALPVYTTREFIKRFIK